MLVKRSIGIAIVLFWCLMNALLIKRQQWAPAAPITIRSMDALTEPSEESWGIFYRGDKIGHASQTITPAGLSSPGLFSFTFATPGHDTERHDSA